MKHKFNVTIEQAGNHFTAKVLGNGTPTRLKSPEYPIGSPEMRKASLCRLVGDIGIVMAFNSFPSAMVLPQEQVKITDQPVPSQEAASPTHSEPQP